MRTLLVSAQRVCRLWYDLIQLSGDLQAALFFKPIRPELIASNKYIRNSLLEETLWPEFLQARVRSNEHKWPENWSKDLPAMDPQRERAYTRARASWRRMFLRQPPEYHVKLFYLHSISLPEKRAIYTPLEISYTDRHMRMISFVQLVRAGILVPCHHPWIIGWEAFGRMSIGRADMDEIWRLQLSPLNPTLSLDRTVVYFVCSPNFHIRAGPQGSGQRYRFLKWPDLAAVRHCLWRFAISPTWTLVTQLLIC